ncbi:choice-of-anchor G family protein [Antiquaquibacter soli]|uniref:Choice-of-anchor G family protein n=1 Tax=Antiquaquibacter soli TaxID=3064523 RepID=A0ABT9BMA0_9MICO|nr:choice-of-anchor G family protein [Protaetiibacter sp. WY-16]MDO7881588.1 choice-of-anchor G family protein [Protaetiibacter sp. WY-16]
MRADRAWFGATMAALGALVLPLLATPSAASWHDREFDRGSLASASCSTGHVSSASGQVLSGSILSTTLSSIASVNGATASSPGSGAAVSSANPLSVSALGSINTQLGGVLALDTGAQAGVLQQFAEARPTGYSAGSAGGVSDSGAISLVAPAAGGTVPRFATVQLGSVLNQLVGGGLGGGISGLSDARLTIGALASYATLDGCAADWSGSVYSALVRQYLVAGLGATLTSPRVSSIVTTTNSGAASIRSSVAAVAGQSGLINSISTATLSALSSTLSGFVVGTPTTTLALDISLSGLATNLATPISDAGGIASIDLGAGTVTVDLARLLGPAYQNSVGLNGLAPNTQLLLNSTAMSALTTAVSSALTSWITGVSTTVNTAAGILDVDLKVVLPISVAVAALGITVPVGTVTVSASHVRLDQLIAGTAPISVTTQLSPPSCAGITGGIICGVVNPLLTGLTSAVSSLSLNGTFGPVVGGLIRTAVTPVPGLSALVTALTSDANALASFLSTALSALFGPSALVSLVVNAQNSPDPAQASSPAGTPPGWSGVAAPSTRPYRTGQYSVAALRLVTLGVTSGGVAIDLARSTVGSNGPVG